MLMRQLQTFSNYFLVCEGVENYPCKCFLENGIETRFPYLGLPPSSNNRKIHSRFCPNLHEKALSDICHEDRAAHFNFTPILGQISFFLLFLCQILSYYLQRKHHYPLKKVGKASLGTNSRSPWRITLAIRLLWPYHMLYSCPSFLLFRAGQRGCGQRNSMPMISHLQPWATVYASSLFLSYPISWHRWGNFQGGAKPAVSQQSTALRPGKSVLLPVLAVLWNSEVVQLWDDCS